MKTKAILILAVSLFFASCSEPTDMAVIDTSKGHLDDFVTKSISATAEIQASGVDVDKTTKLALSIEEFKSAYPEEYATIARETNGWELAKKLKRNKAFCKISLRYGLDIKVIHFIQREAI